MQKRPKLTHIVKSLKNDPILWEEILNKYWILGSQASLGFPIGDPDDSPARALTKEGYEVVFEMSDVAVGTDWLTSIVVVSKGYGPWAVDVTDNLFSTNTKEFSAPTISFEAYKNNTKSTFKPQS